ncbi:hypothetical protein G2W53_016163 [Senna tora]|uniref:Uncharacterized protein n=1 Tax=Senna tora TaxID=362788 RepID=A0A834WWW4_9FABA|nr:hypothetical protein G2W53_016163 [Senna tora]
MMADAGCVEENLASLFSKLSSKSPDKSKPADREMISKAFIHVGTTDSSFASPAILPLSSVSSEGFVPEVETILFSHSGLLYLAIGPFTNQEDSLILAIEILVSGSGSNILINSLRTSGENQLGNLTSALEQHRQVCHKGYAVSHLASLIQLEHSIQNQRPLDSHSHPTKGSLALYHGEFTAFSILDNKVNLTLGSHNLIKLYNIGMSNESHNSYFTLDLISLP